MKSYLLIIKNNTFHKYDYCEWSFQILIQYSTEVLITYHTDK